MEVEARCMDAVKPLMQAYEKVEDAIAIIESGGRMIFAGGKVKLAREAVDMAAALTTISEEKAEKIKELLTKARKAIWERDRATALKTLENVKDALVGEVLEKYHECRKGGA